MPTSFTILLSAFQRLVHLPLAADAEPGSLQHIHLHVQADGARFAATNGKMLAVMPVACLDHSGNLPISLVLDRALFGAAARLFCQCQHQSQRTVRIEISPDEVRFSAGSTVALVRRIETTYPAFDHAFTRTRGKRWVPALGSFSPHLLGIAQKLAGKCPLLLSAVVHPDSRIGQLWSGVPVPSADLMTVPVTQSGQEPVSLAEVQALVDAPGYWITPDLALLLMPITRSADEPVPDLATVLPATLVDPPVAA